MRSGKAVWVWGVIFSAACGARTELQATPAEGGVNGTGGLPATGGSTGGTPMTTGGTGGMPMTTTGGVPIRTRCTLAADDPRVAGIRPDEVATLDGADFVDGDVASYRWTLKAEDCDAVVQNAEFIFKGATTQVVRFQPSRPAPYHFTLEVTGRGGDRATCEIEVPVKGVGLRTELCWDTSTSADLDIYLHNPFNRDPWFEPGSFGVIDGINETTCNTSNAVPMLRDRPRVDWGYASSPVDACNTPSFQGFLSLGRCPNPRASVDNNQSIASGTTERIQLDNPRDGERFRVMAQNFNNAKAKPRLFVYCSGERAGAFEAPSMPANFQGPSMSGFGVMWRIADITTKHDAQGRVVCSAVPVNDRAAVSFDDPSF
jgi:hypothetical protein